jgi:hypothetical protein
VTGYLSPCLACLLLLCCCLVWSLGDLKCGGGVAFSDAGQAQSLLFLQKLGPSCLQAVSPLHWLLAVMLDVPAGEFLGLGGNPSRVYDDLGVSSEMLLAELR